MRRFRFRVSIAGGMLAAATFGCEGVDLGAYLTVQPPPASLGLDSYYGKYVDALGIPIVASARVSDAALYEARDELIAMLGSRLELLIELNRHGTRVAIIGVNEVTTDIPEYARLNELFPENGDYDTRTRGLGGTPSIPTGSTSEENLLGCSQDSRWYRGESVFVHEFAHTVMELGVHYLYPDIEAAVQTAYASAIAEGLWTGTFASTSWKEYWAEGVQCWFDANQLPNHDHGEINTREELEAYDPRLAELIAEVYGRPSWRWSYPAASTSCP